MNVEVMGIRNIIFSEEEDPPKIYSLEMLPKKARCSKPFLIFLGKERV